MAFGFILCYTSRLPETKAILQETLGSDIFITAESVAASTDGIPTDVSSHLIDLSNQITESSCFADISQHDKLFRGPQETGQPAQVRWFTSFVSQQFVILLCCS